MRAETTNPATTAGYAVFTGWIRNIRINLKGGFDDANRAESDANFGSARDRHLRYCFDRN